jgi:hypothetical protein
MHSQVDEDFSCAWLGGVKLLDFGGDGTGFVVDKGLVLLGDLDGAHVDGLKLFCLLSGWWL